MFYLLTTHYQLRPYGRTGQAWPGTTRPPWQAGPLASLTKVLMGTAPDPQRDYAFVPDIVAEKEA